MSTKYEISERGRERLVPTLNRILVEKIIPPSKTSLGILLPEKSSKNSGKVVAVGPGQKDTAGNLIPVSVSLKEGETVLLPDNGGTQVNLGDDKEFTTLSHVLALYSFIHSLRASTMLAKFSRII
ncbi:Chaperonin Cpn10 [Macleaya cordata]|uniref:Chaperonin Cpn10 n=1 Tax=Macleaya cordata TaxID=56857 RepID=A0A200PU50_MACCD|nr:Chaperonin Cpn10 [Macleaya cordata]